VPAQACSGKRHHVVCKHADVKWMVQGYVRPAPIETSRSNLGTPSEGQRCTRPSSRRNGWLLHELLARKRAELDERIDQLRVELTRLDPVRDERAIRSRRAESSGRSTVRFTGSTGC
jgi:hypothetical protein